MKHNIITITSSDTFFTVYCRVKKAFPDGEGKAFLVMKKVGPFFRNTLFLQLLVRHFPGVTFSLISRNKAYAAHCRKYGIVCYSRMRDVQMREFSFGQEILLENFTFWQFFSWFIRRSFLRTKKNWFVSYNRYREYFSRVKSSILFLLILGICIAGLLMIAILIFTLPKTVITLTPETFVTPVRANMVFIEEDLAGGLHTYEVPIRRYRYTTSYTDTFVIRNYDVSNAGQAQGDIRMYNFGAEDIRLRPSTRLQTSSGLVYRTTDWVTVQAGDPSTSYIDVRIVADHYDAQGSFTGSRANIGTGEFFFLPGLQTDASSDTIRAESISEFFGGTDDVVPIFDEKQYETFLGLYTEKMAVEAEKDILHSIDEVEDGYYILPIHGITRPVDIKVQTDYDPGDRVPEVTFTGVGEFETVVFDIAQANKHLLTIASSHLLQDAQEIIEAPEGMVDVVHVFYQETDPYRIKATVQSDIAYRYKLDSESVRQQFVDDFLGEVLGKKKNEALKTLLNNPMIARARIRITPFWRDQISYDSRDVVFKIQE